MIYATHLILIAESSLFQIDVDQCESLKQIEESDKLS